MAATRVELQHLVRYYTTIYDFSIGAEIFIKAMAKRVGLKGVSGLEK